MKDTEKKLNVIYLVLGIFLTLLSICVIVLGFMVKQPNTEILQYKQRYWPAPEKPAVHKGQLKIQVIDNENRKAQKIEKVFVLCAKKQQDQVSLHACIEEAPVSIGDCEDTEVNVKLCGQDSWLADKPQYVPYGEKPLVHDQYTILVNGVDLHATNTGRSGDYHNYFIRLKKE